MTAGSAVRLDRPERGSISLFVAILSLFFFMMIAVVAEGNRKLANIGLAQDLASEAARAASATLDLESIANGDPRIDVRSTGAHAEARRVVDTHPGAQVLSVDIKDDALAVSVTVRVEDVSWIPGFDASGTATHLAQIIGAAGQ